MPLWFHCPHCRCDWTRKHFLVRCPSCSGSLEFLEEWSAPLPKLLDDDEGPLDDEPTNPTKKLCTSCTFAVVDPGAECAWCGIKDTRHG